MASSVPSNLPPGYLEADKSYHVRAVAISFIVVETLVTVMRSFARRFQRTRWMWSDVFMPISLLFNLSVCTCALLGARWGAGKHALAVPPEDVVPFTILNYYGIATMYPCAVTFSKLAILDLYLHIFVEKRSRMITYAVGVVVTLSCVANEIATIAQCKPVDFLWNPTPGGWCQDIHAHFTWASMPNIITDFLMLLLPIPMIWKLHASWRVKAGIFITFLVGSFGMVTSIIRFVEFWNYGWNNGYSDPTWISDTILSWTVVEPGVYHLTACFITFRPLFRWIVFESPLSSILSRSRLISGSKSTTNGTVDQRKGVSDTIPGRATDFASDRKSLVFHGSGHSESFATRDDEVHRMDDLDMEREIQVEHAFQVSKT